MAIGNTATMSAPGQVRGYNHNGTRMIAFPDGETRTHRCMGALFGLLATILMVLFQWGATTADAERRAELGRHVHPYATDADLNIYQHSCHDATLRQALRERGGVVGGIACHRASGVSWANGRHAQRPTACVIRMRDGRTSCAVARACEQNTGRSWLPLYTALLTEAMPSSRQLPTTRLGAIADAKDVYARQICHRWRRSGGACNARRQSPASRRVNTASV